MSRARSTRLGSARRYRRAAALAAVLLVLITAAVFAGQNPFSQPFTVRVAFSSAAQLHKGGEVRIAGLKVGQVDAIAAGRGNSSIVTLAIDPGGLPIHSDATFAIKPRLVLEGNGYVDVHPGTPAAPSLRSGSTVGLRQTSVAVQIDQVLNTFDLPTRNGFWGSVGELASGFGGGSLDSGAGGSAPSGGAGSGPSGATGLREAVRQFDGALGSVTQVASAVQGTQPGDLGRAIGSSGSVTAQLAENPPALADLVSSYNGLVGALASRDQALAASISGFDAVLRAAPVPLRQIDGALPTLTRFANTLRPALHAAPHALGLANGLLDQIAATVRPHELPALLLGLTPVLRDLPGLEQRLGTLFGYSTPVTNCIYSNVVPTLQMKIQDGVNTTGDPVYLDLMHLFTGLTAFSSAVDGNGGDVRLGVTTGDRIVSTIFPGLGQVVGQLPNVNGVRPTWLGFGVNPAFRPDQPCAGQPLPNLGARSGPAPQWARGH